MCDPEQGDRFGSHIARYRDCSPDVGTRDFGDNKGAGDNKRRADGRDDVGRRSDCNGADGERVAIANCNGVRESGAIRTAAMATRGAEASGRDKPTGRGAVRGVGGVGHCPAGGDECSLRARTAKDYVDVPLDTARSASPTTPAGELDIGVPVWRPLPSGDVVLPVDGQVHSVGLESGASDEEEPDRKSGATGSYGSFGHRPRSSLSNGNVNNNAKTDKKAKKSKKSKKAKEKTNEKDKKEEPEKKSIGVDTEYVIGLAAAFKYAEIGFVLGEGISAYMTGCFSKHYGLYLTEYTKATACFSFVVTLFLYFLMLCRMPERYPYSCTILHKHYVFSFFAFIVNAVASVLNGILLCDKPRYFMMGFAGAAALTYGIDGIISHVALKNKQKDKLAKSLNRRW